MHVTLCGMTACSAFGLGAFSSHDLDVYKRLASYGMHAGISSHERAQGALCAAPPL